MADPTSNNTSDEAAGSVDPTLAAAPARSNRGKAIGLGLGAAVLVAAGIGLAVVLGGNGEDSGGSETVPTAGATAGAADPGATLTVGLSLEPTSLDIRTVAGAALDQALIGNVYEALVTRDPSGELKPALAKSWEVSEDAKTYTFKLQSGVKFSNGHDLTAEEAAWSIQQVIDGNLVDAAQLAKVSEVVAEDSTTLTVKLSEPYPDLLWALSGRPGLVLDPAATNDLASTAIGSGPFLFDSWKQGDSITLLRNEDYWGEKAGVAQVVLRYITDQNAQLSALNSGDLDVLAPISNDLRDQVTVEDAEFFIAEAPDKFVLAFNNARAPLDQKEVRQAIRHALDHEAIVAARGDVDKVQGGPIPPVDPGYEDLSDLYPYDPDKAKELLAQAGHPDGLELTLTVPSFYGTVLPDLVVSQLGQVGIKVNVNAVEFSTWLEDVYTNHDYDLSIVDHAESRDFGSWADPTGYFGYNNAEVQKLYGEAQTAATEADAAAKLAAAARIVSEEAAADWLINFRQSVALRPGIDGFPNALINTRLELAGVTATKLG